MYAGCPRFYSFFTDDWFLSNCFNLTPKDYMADDWYLIEPMSSKTTTIPLTTYVAIKKRTKAVLGTYVDENTARNVWSHGLADRSIDLVESVANYITSVPIKQWRRKEVKPGDAITAPEGAQFFAEWQE